MPPAAGPAVPGSCHHPWQRQDRPLVQYGHLRR